jgi:hypothetical protein
MRSSMEKTVFSLEAYWPFLERLDNSRRAVRTLSSMVR